MKVTLYGCVVVLTVFVSLPAYALEPFLLYDDFNLAFLAPDKWDGFDFGGCCAVREAVREIRGHRLRLAYRMHGDLVDGGQRAGGTRVHFVNSPTVTAVKATVQVQRLEVTDCPTTPDPSSVQVNLQGFFFNTTAPTDGHTDDVTARIQILRSSIDLNPPDVLHVRALVQQCLDAPCATSLVLDDQDLGTVLRGQSVRLQLQWDPDNDRFIFRVNNNPQVFSSYTVSDTAPAGGNSKFIDVTTGVANCAAAPRSVAFIDAGVDNVFVNASAVP